MGAKVEKPRESKKAQLIRLLSAKAGADVGAISSKLGWLPHTTRAAITGLKKAGYEVTTEKPDPEKPTRYRITAKPKAAAVGDTAPEPAHAG
jgi:predicted ArsR family transcriptional regulator